jgi:hypothetical protein
MSVLKEPHSITSQTAFFTITLLITHLEHQIDRIPRLSTCSNGCFLLILIRTWSCDQVNVNFSLCWATWTMWAVTHHVTVSFTWWLHKYIKTNYEFLGGGGDNQKMRIMPEVEMGWNILLHCHILLVVMN